MTQPGPLHLRRGDPVPALAIAGFDLVDFAHAWLLLIVCEIADTATVDAALNAATSFEKRLEIRFVAAETAVPSDLTGRVLADPDGIAARRLGALVGADTRFPVAVLIEPGGRAYASASGPDVAVAVEAAIVAAKTR